MNTGHEYSSVSLLGEDPKCIASPLAVIVAVMQSFQLGRDCLSSEQKEPNAISIQLFLGLDAVAALAQPVPTLELREWFCHSSPKAAA